MRGFLAVPLALMFLGDAIAAKPHPETLTAECRASDCVPCLPRPELRSELRLESPPESPAATTGAHARVVRDVSMPIPTSMPERGESAPSPAGIRTGLPGDSTQPLLIALAAAALLNSLWLLLMNRRLRWSQHRLETEARRGHATLEASRRHQAALAHALQVGTVGEMATGLAHELNQPLAAIINYAQGSVRRVQSGALEPSQLVRPLVDITRQAERAADIVRHVRQMVRRGEPQCVRSEINDIVCLAVRWAQLEGGAERLQFALELDVNLPPVFVDPLQLEQAVLHIVSNAIEAAGSCDRPGGQLGDLSNDQCGGRVTVRTQLNAAGRVQVSVTDNGPGITPELKGRLFSPFATTKAGRMGMGLAISQTIIESHQGELTGSAVEGGGAVFSFDLPPAPRSEAD